MERCDMQTENQTQKKFTYFNCVCQSLLEIKRNHHYPFAVVCMLFALRDN